MFQCFNVSMFQCFKLSAVLLHINYIKGQYWIFEIMTVFNNSFAFFADVISQSSKSASFLNYFAANLFDV